MRLGAAHRSPTPCAAASRTARRRTSPGRATAHSDRARHPPGPDPRRDRAPHRGLDHPSRPELGHGPPRDRHQGEVPDPGPRQSVPDIVRHRVGLVRTDAPHDQEVSRHSPLSPSAAPAVPVRCPRPGSRHETFQQPVQIQPGGDLDRRVRGRRLIGGERPPVGQCRSPGQAGRQLHLDAPRMRGSSPCTTRSWCWSGISARTGCDSLRATGRSRRRCRIGCHVRCRAGRAWPGALFESQSELSGRQRMLSRDRTRCPRCPASRCTTHCGHRQAALARVPRRARPVVRTRLRVRQGALHPRARCRPAHQDADDS